MFPGYYTRRIDIDDDDKGAKVEKKLNVRNTLAKFMLDQTLAALVNVVAFLGGVRLLNGESLEVSWQVVKEVRCSIPTRAQKFAFWKRYNKHTRYGASLAVD